LQFHIHFHGLFRARAKRGNFLVAYAEDKFPQSVRAGIRLSRKLVDDNGFVGKFQNGKSCRLERLRAWVADGNAADAFEKAREYLRAFFGAEDPASIVFTSGTTMGANIIAHAWARENLEEGDVVVSTMMEHHANLVPWQILKKERGISLELVEISNGSFLNISSLEEKLSSGRVKLVCVGHVSNVSATLNPVKKIAEIAHRAGAAVFVDGAQSAGHMPVNVSEIGADFFACSGHKMLGPMGTGILYVHPDRFGEMGVMFGGGDMISRVTPERAWFKPMPTKLEYRNEINLRGRSRNHEKIDHCRFFPWLGNPVPRKLQWREI